MLYVNMAEDLDEETTGIEKVLSLQVELEKSLVNIEDEEERKDVLFNYIENLSSDETLKVSDFGLDFEWINTTKPLSLRNDLKGKIVILDFFTYCCINCMHILPDLFYIEEKIPVEKGLIVVGIHSAKFDNEKHLTNLTEAVRRHEIHHPVVNDSQGIIWNQLRIYCWPTLVVLGPDNNMLFMFVGEGHREQLTYYCEVALRYFIKKEKILTTSIPVSHLEISSSIKSLLFPSKICLNSQDDKIIISDSGHHRILVLNREGVVLNIIGGMNSGFKDGNFSEAKFHSPQGVAWKDPGLIYVADTENHVIRKIDLNNRTVKTVAGTGKQGKDKFGGKRGTEQEINSPWDVCLWHSNGDGICDLLFIAMAGSHQVWILCLEDTEFCNESIQKETCINFAGSGKEENRNNRYRKRAGFAQPSGITVVKVDEQEYLYVSDSESSTIRYISLADGSVAGCIGGDRNPDNLFAFGDTDGNALNAKLQHPLDVAWSASKKLLYVADTYNNKIKVVNLFTKDCTTLYVKSCEAYQNKNLINDMELFEPGGICVADDGNTLFVTDTNNHIIRIIDLRKNMYSNLNIIWNDKEIDVPDHLYPDRNTVSGSGSAIVIPTNGHLILRITFDFQDEFCLTENANQTWNVQISDESSLEVHGESTGNISDLFPFYVTLKSTNAFASADVTVILKLFLCHKVKQVCFSKTFIYKIPIICKDISSEKEIVFDLPIKLKL